MCYKGYKIKNEEYLTTSRNWIWKNFNTPLLIIKLDRLKVRSEQMLDNILQSYPQLARKCYQRILKNITDKH